MLATRSRGIVIRTITKSVLIAAAGSAMVLGGAAAANAQPGIVDAQSGNTVDVDGTWGDMRNSMWGAIDSDGTWGDMRLMSTEATDSHEIVSDACAIVGKGCQPQSRYDSRNISAISGGYGR